MNQGHTKCRRIHGGIYRRNRSIFRPDQSASETSDQRQFSDLDDLPVADDKIQPGLDPPVSEPVSSVPAAPRTSGRIIKRPASYND